MKRVLSLIVATVMLTSLVAVVPAHADDFAGGVVLTTYANEEVKLLPDYNKDLSVERSVIRDGGFEAKGEKIVGLDTAGYWKGEPFTFVEGDCVEGSMSVALDFSKIDASKDVRGEMGFTQVFIEPCADDECYQFEFYTKAAAPLAGDPNIMIYFMNANNTKPAGIRTGNCSIDVNQRTLANSEWGAQKWIRVRNYFRTDPSFNEGAHTLQLQYMSGDPTNKIMFDAFSLTKMKIDKATMDPSLFVEQTVDPIDTEKPTVKKVKFAKKAATVKVKKTITLKVNVKASFKSSKAKIAKVMTKGKAKAVKVKGIKKGKATITASANGKKATCKVTVKK